jgi:hypothetical protein
MKWTWYSYIRMAFWFGLPGLSLGYLDRVMDIGIFGGVGMILLLLAIGAGVVAVPGIYLDAKEVKNSHVPWNPSPSLYFLGCIFITPVVVFPIYMWKRKNYTIR